MFRKDFTVKFFELVLSRGDLFHFKKDVLGD